MCSINSHFSYFFTYLLENLCGVWTWGGPRVEYWSRNLLTPLQAISSTLLAYCMLRLTEPLIPFNTGMSSSLQRCYHMLYLYEHFGVSFVFQMLLARFAVGLGGIVVSALGMRTRRPRFESRVAPLFHWVATLCKLFAHIASPVSQLQEIGVQKGAFGT